MSASSNTTPRKFTPKYIPQFVPKFDPKAAPKAAPQSVPQNSTPKAIPKPVPKAAPKPASQSSPKSSADKSKITGFFHKKCVDCGRSHTNTGVWCIGCRGGVVKRGTHKGESYRYVLQRQTKYAKWIAFENGDQKYKSFRRWIITNPTRSKIVTDCKDTIETLEESDSEDSCSDTEPSSDLDEMPPPPSFKLNTTGYGPSFSSNPRVRLQIDDDTLIRVGKHHGRSYNWIHLYDPSYCDWVRGLDTVSPGMTKFKNWLIGRF